MDMSMAHLNQEEDLEDQEMTLDSGKVQSDREEGSSSPADLTQDPDDDDEEDENEDEEDVEEEEEEEEDEDAKDMVRHQEVIALQEALSGNPANYEAHVKLITLLRDEGELEQVREAREAMAKVYPLSPSLWLDWTRDETKIAASAEDRERVTGLFERATRDYLSAELWLEYAQFAMGSTSTPQGIEKVRQVLEQALMHLGLDAAKGSLIWEVYREFESAILLMLPENDEGKTEREKQIKRVYNLFKRQLSVPLLEMDKAWAEFKQWHECLSESNPELELSLKEVKYGYEKGLSQLQRLKPYEDALLSSPEPHLEEYKKYIEYEEANGTPARVQCIYERALTDNCLLADLWLKYTLYLDTKVKNESIISPIYGRAVRNCPWSLDLWLNYMRSMERLGQHSEVMNVLEAAIEVRLQQGEQYRQLWMTYIDCLRRQTDFKDEKQVEKLRKTFTTASEHLSQFEDGDPNATLDQYLAKVEAKFCANVSEGRNIWNDLLNKRRDLSGLALMWVEFYYFEKVFGDEKHLRRILLRGLQYVTDWPETVGELLLKHEKEEGTSIETWDEARAKYEDAMNRIKEKRRKEAEKEIDQRKLRKVQKKQEKYEEKQKKRKEGSEGKREASPGKVDKEGFKIPFNPTSQFASGSSAPKKRRLDSSETPVADKVVKSKPPPPAPQVRPPGSFRPANQGNDDARSLLTVFVSNLDFKVDEDKLRDIFSQFGEVTDVRLVRNFKGFSKGFCYVEFANIESVKNALKNDRMKIEERPTFISELDKRSNFKFANEMEKNKLYVKNLNLELNESDLRNVFEKYGDLKDIRIVTYRNGHSKGSAYVEYKDELSANKALAANGLLLKDRNIEVAISNPPGKRNPDSGRDPTMMLGSAIIGSHSSRDSSHAKIKINAPMIPASVRRQQMQQQRNGGAASSNGKKTDDRASSLSNSDFRKLLMK